MREPGCPIPNIPVFQHSIIPSFFPRGSAHEPPPENPGSGREVNRSWTNGGHVRTSTPLNRPSAYVRGPDVEV
jgi:hypothetical protein